MVKFDFSPARSPCRKAATFGYVSVTSNLLAFCAREQRKCGWIPYGLH